MHRTDGANNVANMFVDKVPGVSPGTIVEEDWLNAIQEELVAIPLDRGIALVKGTNDQILTALRTVTRVAPTMASGWTSGPSAQPSLFYYKDITGHVHLEGTCAHGTDGDGVTVFTLPAGFRPPFARQFLAPIVSGGGGVASVIVFANGEVRPGGISTAGDTVDTNILYLDGISFHI